MTPEQYLSKAENRAGEVAGLDAAGWNLRYLNALRERGFTIRPVTPEEKFRRPEGSIDAPWPHPDDPCFRWPVPSVIVPADDP